jgi:hypothetical protein
MAFEAGKRLTAQLLNNTFPESKSDTQLTLGTTVSTSFVTALTGGTTCGVSFTAPLSGKVNVFLYSRQRNSGANATLLSVRLGTGTVVDSGTEVTAANDNSVTQIAGTTDMGASTLVPFTGLFAGFSYNVVLKHRVTAGTGTYASRKVVVVPVI